MSDCNTSALTRTEPQPVGISTQAHTYQLVARFQQGDSPQTVLTGTFPSERHFNLALYIWLTGSAKGLYTAQYGLNAVVAIYERGITELATYEDGKLIVQSTHEPCSASQAVAAVC